MNPDDYEPQEHRYPEVEEEFLNLDGEDFYVVGTVVGTRCPVTKPDGRLGSESSFHWETPPQVFPCEGDGYSDCELTGEALSAWLAKHGEEVAAEIAERIDDKWVTHMEERDSR